MTCDVLPGHHDGDREGQDEDASDGAETADKLSQEGCRVHIIPNSCQRHQTPPERVIKWPKLFLGSLSLNGKYEAGVEKYCYDHDDEQEAELLVRLPESVDETLQPRKVSHHLEDPHDSHDPQQTDDLPRLPDDLQVLKTNQNGREEEGGDGEKVYQIHFVTEEPSLLGADN